MNVPKMFETTVDKNPDKIMFYFEDQKWTFKEVSWIHWQSPYIDRPILFFVVLHMTFIHNDNSIRISFQVDKYSNKIANYFLSMGFQKGDTVALLMENRPEYVATWLGLAKIGVVTALINHNQKCQALIHAVRAANSKAIIYGTEFTSGTSLIIPRNIVKKTNLLI